MVNEIKHCSDVMLHSSLETETVGTFEIRQYGTADCELHVIDCLYILR